MYYKEVIAKNFEDALNLIKKDYGDSATIIKHEDFYTGGFLGMMRKKSVKVKYSVSDDVMLRKYKENMGIKSPKKNIANPETTEIRGHDNGRSAFFEKESMKFLLNRLDEIDNKISSVKTNDKNVHPEITRLKEILKENEFYDDFINEIAEDAECSLSYSQLSEPDFVHRFVLNQLLNKIKVTPKNIAKEGEKKVVVLVGPTGVGKTTTVAKLAANAIRDKLSVELVTIDGFRIGAKYQLEKYAEYMMTPISGVEDNLSLQRIVDLSNAELILIDTIGRSQQDEINIVKMKKMLELQRCDCEFILTISAVTKPREVIKIFKSFEMFDFYGVIVTKCDESETMGAILNEIINRKKTLRYITDGQKVPNDIKKGSRQILTEKIKGFDASVYFSNELI